MDSVVRPSRDAELTLDAANDVAAIARAALPRTLPLALTITSGTSRVAYCRMLRVASSEHGNCMALRSVVAMTRGQGWGRALLRAAEELTKRLGVRWLYVSVNDDKGQAGALGFYEHLGFKVCAPYGESSSGARVAALARFADPDASTSAWIFLKKDLGSSDLASGANTEKLRAFYDTESRSRNDRPLQGWKAAERDAFAQMLPSRAALLELGSGPGRDARFFTDLGCDVECIDLSPEMVQCCADAGLRATVFDFSSGELPHEDGAFDACYAMNSCESMATLDHDRLTAPPPRCCIRHRLTPPDCPVARSAARGQAIAPGRVAERSPRPPPVWTLLLGRVWWGGL